MHICMLTYYYWPVPAGGTENQCRRLSAALVARSHTCTVLTSCHESTNISEEEEASGVRIIRKPILETILYKIRGSRGAQGLGGKTDYHAKSGKKTEGRLPNLKKKAASWTADGLRYGNIFFFALGVLSFLRKNHNSIDILHVHTADWIAGLTALAGKFFSIPVVCKGADMPVFPPLHAVPLAADCDIWRRKPHFIALTPAMQNDLIQGGIQKTKITVIPNGVELPTQTVAVEKNEDFLYIGNFSQSAAHKGFDLLIKAWAEFHRQCPSPRLILLGGGDAAPWLHLAHQLNCLDSIDFAGYQKELTAFFNTSCCLLLPSRKEGISNALLEAQSWGLPAIVSDIPGNREVVEEQHTGIIVPVEDSAALTKAMVSLYKDKDTRQAYGRAARKRMEDFFALDRVAERTVRLYEELSG
ncbi:MAG: glycosyltransferase family 1 protein [Candidatus Electrothrix sp. AR3]|nr:glycosyltransferase family 1 protein [Candidatus Electrothrix sp. AR3]